MGQNVPKPKDDEGGDSGQKDHDKDKDHNSIGGHHHSVKTGDIHIVFRDLFNDFLKMKYSFYQNPLYRVKENV